MSNNDKKGGLINISGIKNQLMFVTFVVFTAFLIHKATTPTTPTISINVPKDGQVCIVKDHSTYCGDPK